jgi:hypothetical protein
MDIKIDTTTNAWKWLLAMKKEYQRAKEMDTKTIEAKSLIDGRKVGQIVFGREN